MIVIYSLLISITRVYYRNTAGAAIVFDITRQESLNLARHWLQDIRENVVLPDGSSLPIILLGNKCDSYISNCDNYIPLERITKFCQENDIAAWCATSALMDLNITKSFNYLIQAALKIKILASYDEDIIRVKAELRNEIKRRDGQRACCSGPII